MNVRKIYELIKKPNRNSYTQPSELCIRLQTAECRPATIEQRLHSCVACIDINVDVYSKCILILVEYCLVLYCLHRNYYYRCAIFSLKFTKKFKKPFGGRAPPLPQPFWAVGPLTFIVLVDSLQASCMTHRFVDDAVATLSEIVAKSSTSRMQAFFCDELVQQSEEARMNVNGRKTKRKRL